MNESRDIKQIGGLKITLYNETIYFSNKQIWTHIKFVMKDLKKIHLKREPYKDLGITMSPRHIAIIVRECTCAVTNSAAGRYVKLPYNKVWIVYNDGHYYNGVITVNAISSDYIHRYPLFYRGYKYEDKYGKDEYLGKLLLSPEEELISILAHELRHVFEIWNGLSIT